MDELLLVSAYFPWAWCRVRDFLGRRSLGMRTRTTGDGRRPARARSTALQRYQEAAVRCGRQSSPYRASTAGATERSP